MTTSSSEISTFYSDYFVDYKQLMDDVVLVDGPQSAYVVKAKPAILQCKALNAKRIRFKCDGRWLDDSRHVNEDGVDETTQRAFLRTSVEIGRAELDAHQKLADYICQCYASGQSDSQAVRSDAARIRVAYMRKHFYQVPVSDIVPEGRTVQLPCSPPDADPKVELIWQKDGKEIERRMDSNIILANDGSLIISAARLTDSGNYTCVAENIANRRSTDPALITVFVDGQWAEWSQWAGSCRMDCASLRQQVQRTAGDREALQRVLPRQTRTRTCNNPAPINGGAECAGQDLEQRQCPNDDCQLDGQWTAWSSWSACSPQCHKFRNRECAAPAPAYGGMECVGRNLETKNCTMGYCNNYGRLDGKSSSTLEMTNEMGTYAAVAGGAVLLVLVVGLLLRLICGKRGRCWKRKKLLPDIYYPDNSAHVRTVLLQQQHPLLGPAMIGSNENCFPSKYPPSIVPGQFYTIASTNSPTPHCGSFTLRSGKSSGSGYSGKRNGAGSRAALIAESSSNSSAGGKVAVIRSATPRSEDDNYATLYELDDSGAKSSSSLRSYSCPADNGSDAIAVANVDKAGLRLEGETPLSSVIFCGPLDLVLKKPVVISFEHCASLFPKDNWQLTLYTDNGNGWHPIVRIGDENLNTPAFCQVDQLKCHVMFDQLGKLQLIGRTRPTNNGQLHPAAKRVRLSAFAPVHCSTPSFSMRIYCLPETSSAMQTVVEQEDRLGFGKFGESRHFLLRETGPLCICVEDVSNGCVIRPGSLYQEIPDAHHEWCARTGLHCDVALQAQDADLTEIMTARVVVYQKGNADARHVLDVQLREPSTSSRSAIYDEANAFASGFLLDVECKRHLAELLDPPVEKERDWRLLARKLGVDRYIQYFAIRPSPTEAILDLWEAREAGSERAALDLLQILRVIGRPDAAQLLDGYLLRMADLNFAPN